MHKYLQHARPYFMCLFPLLFFAFQFILRLWPSLTMQHVMHQFSIDASAFGLLASLYYYGYAGMQIPVAVLLDRFGARSIILCCATLCGGAFLIFSTTESWVMACLSRFLIGAGSAVGFLGVSKVITQWFPKDQYARMVGFSFTFGLMGAIYGGKPTSLLIDVHGPTSIALGFALISIALGLGTYLFLKPYTPSEDSAPDTFKIGHFKQLLSSPAIWVLAFGNFLMVGALEGFADVWGVPFLMTAFGFAKSDAAEMVSYIFVGMLFGGPALALLASKLGNYTIISLCGFGMATALIILLNTQQANWYWLMVLFVSIGIMCCYQVLVFSAGSDFVPSQLLGVTVAFLNCINMFGGSFFHSLIGWFMDFFWTGQLNPDATPVYTLDSYIPALSVIPVCAVTGALMIASLGFRQRQSTPQLQKA